MNVHIRAAEVTQRFAHTPIARFKDAPGMGRLFEPLPSDGQAKLERHVESRRRGSDRKSTRLNSSHLVTPYAVFCLKKKNSVLVITGPVRTGSAVRNNTDPKDQGDETRQPGSHRQIFQFVFFFNDAAATEIYTLSLHDALPI